MSLMTPHLAIVNGALAHTDSRTLEATFFSQNLPPSPVPLLCPSMPHRSSSTRWPITWLASSNGTTRGHFTLQARQWGGDWWMNTLWPRATLALISSHVQVSLWFKLSNLWNSKTFVPPICVQLATSPWPTTDMMTPCWPFPGQQQHLRAFASAFGPDTRPFLDHRNYTALTGLTGPPGHSDFARLIGKSPAEAWALHAASAAALMSNDFPRRFHHPSTPTGHPAITGGTALHPPPPPPPPASSGHGATGSGNTPGGHGSTASLQTSASVPGVTSLTSLDPIAAAAAAAHLSNPYSRFFAHGYPPTAASGLAAAAAAGVSPSAPGTGPQPVNGSSVNYSPLASGTPGGLFNSVTGSSNSASNLPPELSHHHSPLSSLYSREFNGTSGHHSNHNSNSSLSPSPHLPIAPSDRSGPSARSPSGNHFGSNHHSLHQTPGSVHLHSADSSDSYSIRQERSSVISDPGNDVINPSSSASSSPSPLEQHQHQQQANRKGSSNVINSSHGKSSPRSNTPTPCSSPVPSSTATTTTCNVNSSSSGNKSPSRGTPISAATITPSAGGATTHTTATLPSSHLPHHATVHHHSSTGVASLLPSNDAPSVMSEAAAMSVTAAAAAAAAAAVGLHPSMYPGFLAAAVHGFGHPNGPSPFGPSSVTASAARYPHSLMASGLTSLHPSLVHLAAADPVAFATVTGATGASLAVNSSSSLGPLTSASSGTTTNSGQIISTATASVTGTMSNSTSNATGNLWRPY